MPFAKQAGTKASSLHGNITEKKIGCCLKNLLEIHRAAQLKGSKQRVDGRFVKRLLRTDVHTKNHR
jgi:hypothetical protein